MVLERAAMTYIVESDRRNLHQRECEHAEAELEANPSRWARVFCAEAKNPHANGGQE